MMINNNQPIKGSIKGTAQDVIWAEVVSWLSRLRILEGVPFRYIVPHEEMLPNESIRFFHIDRNWLDALVDGALSVGRIGSEESKYDADKYEDLMIDLNDSEREHRPFANMLFSNLLTSAQGSPSNLEVGGGEMSGFLLRSSVVRDYPGLEISAFDGSSAGSTFNWQAEHRIPTIRQQKLSESLMICIFNGIPTHLRIEQPKEGMRQGMDPQVANYNNPPFTLKLKNSEGELLESLGINNLPGSIMDESSGLNGSESMPADPFAMEVFTRKLPNDNSVLNIQSIFDEAIRPERNLHSSAAESSVIATQTLQYPYQQDFWIGEKLVNGKSSVQFSSDAFDHIDGIEVNRTDSDSTDRGV